MATRCGEYGNFTMTWDDVPGFIPIENNTFLAPPVVNAYHHLFSASGYAYVPPGYEPYPPASAPNVAMFFPITGLMPNLPFVDSVRPGEIGAGPRASVNSYWFHAYNAFFGCDNPGPLDCTMRISGYQYDAAVEQEVLVTQQNTTIPACFGFKDCVLTQVDFSDQFRNLSGIQFEAFLINDILPSVFMVDSLAMGWYNNSCSSGILRMGSRK
ncbi:uncharacterized protein BDZ99DRAFT_420119 [Mytilinidion resinicola]|uniref:DUF7371 domain-containing protein n=1 Tax=Mytilinidion resinicola TaxID=574789 RepID=A0A6A6YFV6_9PEZI|nr:uncharacterized protein BDZ99DRAFT_420119 [Mytilinidion resinicola]KAF2807682.1 hypothetical protein BDZ99DRAFT_420119 [Mytilinidion resinicola]